MLKVVQEPKNTASKPGGGSSTKQHTLAAPVTITGKVLLLGEDATVIIHPAPPDHGIVFQRTDLSPAVNIPALVTNVTERARRTTLKLGNTVIETVEHCMSAFAGLRIDNALVAINGPELPCGDGSAAPFVDPITAVGVVEQDAPRRLFKVSEPIIVEQDDAMLAAFPSKDGEFQLIFDLD